MADLSAAISANATSELLATAASLLRLEDWAGAIAAAEAQINDPLQRTDAMAVLAAAAFRSGQLVSAIQLMSHLLDEDATTSDIPELLAVLNCLIGRVSEALYYGKVGALIKPDHRYIPLFGPSLPSFADAFRAMATKPLLAEARKQLEGGNTAKAAELMEQHLEIYPNDIEALDAYGLALMSGGRPRDAIGILRSAMTLGGPSATVFSRLAQALTQIGDVESGIACHREAASRAPQSAALWAAQLRDLNYLPWTDSSAHRNAADGLAALLAANQPKTPRRAPPAAEKPVLTIGYLCSTNLDQASRAMITNIARAHDRKSVTVVGFGTGELSIPANISFRGAFDRWRNIT
ncbi:MAG: hypothetical protein K2X44_10675, partial [Magnetospirillum sp.]|nr:hypothetical protein [Magnetospirillum sp.]